MRLEISESILIILRNYDHFVQRISIKEPLLWLMKALAYWFKTSKWYPEEIRMTTCEDCMTGNVYRFLRIIKNMRP